MQRGGIVYLVKRDGVGKVSEVCLGMKKVRYAKGKWNGFGGKVEENESVEDAAVREVFEECKLRIRKDDLKKMAEIVYVEPAGDWVVYAFTCEKWSGEPKETEEMKPKWFLIKEIPYKKMWENDKLWLPRILKGEKLKGKIVHDEKDKVVKHEFVLMESLE